MRVLGGPSVRRTHAAAAALAALVVALIAFAALPALALATSSEVNSAAEEPDESSGSGTCSTAAGKCTLRAAVETANSDTAADVITFDPTVFEGLPGTDEITLTSALPPIEHPVSIRGGHCGTSPNFRPCAGVIGFAGAPTFAVEAADVEISGLALAGGAGGIAVEGASGFVATGNWIGINLNEAAAGPTTGGIALAAGSDGATIGASATTAEEAAKDRNVIGNTKFGVYVRGASHVKVEGNYIGVGPDGLTVAPVEFGVTLVSEGGVTPDPAEEDDIGGTPAAATTAACEGPCNVISASKRGIDLSGESAEGVTPAAGPVRVRGNFLGLSADGSTALFPTFHNPMDDGVWAGLNGTGPGHVTVGGPSATEANYFVAVEFGIFAQHAERFRAYQNVLGMNPQGEEREPPTETAIAVISEGVTEPAEIVANRMRLGADPFGVVNLDVGAKILENAISGSFTGIRVGGAEGGTANLIQNNSVSSADVFGLRLENSDNQVLGNHIGESGRYGIYVDEGAFGNQIGGDETEEENTIEGSGAGGAEPDEAGAIVINGEEDEFNEVRGNHGAGNLSPFIQLFGHSSHETPNGNIKPPTFATSLQSSASGTAAPGATVRVFSKATTDPGELQSEIGLAVADGTGHWSATYPKQAVGTLLAATQTLNGGTSEVSTPPVAAAADPPEPEKKTEPSTSPSSPSGQPATTPPAKIAPTVKIAKGPKKTGTATTAKFKFSASIAGATFECKLDGKKWSACRSPKNYKGLKDGKHAFRVRATANGVTGPVTLSKFTVKQ